jgi:hypothetical protein
MRFILLGMLTLIPHQTVLHANDSIISSFGDVAFSDPLLMPITNLAGRTLETRIMAIGEDSLTFRSTADGREYSVPFEKLSVESIDQITALKRSGVFEPYEWPGLKFSGRLWYHPSKDSSILSILYMLYLRDEELSMTNIYKYSRYSVKSGRYDEYNAIQSPINFIQVSFTKMRTEYPIRNERNSSRVEFRKGKHQQFLNSSNVRKNPFKRKTAEADLTEQEVDGEGGAGFIKWMNFSPINIEALNGSVKNFISVHLAEIKEPQLVSTRPDYLIVELDENYLTVLNLSTLKVDRIEYYAANKLPKGFSIQLRIPRHEVERLSQLENAVLLKIKDSNVIDRVNDFAIAYCYKIRHD